MTEYIDKTEVMRRFKPFGREIPKEQVMAVLARVDEGIVRCKDCIHEADNYCYKHSHEVTDTDFCSCGERKGEEIQGLDYAENVLASILREQEEGEK